MSRVVTGEIGDGGKVGQLVDRDDFKRRVLALHQGSQHALANAPITIDGNAIFSGSVRHDAMRLLEKVAR